MHGRISFWRMLLCALAVVLFAAPQSQRLQAQDQESLTTPATAPAEWEIEFIVESPPPSSIKSLTFDPIDTKQDMRAVREYISLVRRELKRNPELIEATGLRYYIIVRNLRASAGHERGLAPDVKNRAIYATGRGEHNRVYQRHCVHHEFFHYLIGVWKKDMYFKDPEWMAFNPPGTKYGSGGAKARGSDQYTLTHPAPGFINKYSQSGVEEDMAEVFAALQVPEERRLLMQWAREDEALRNKINYMQELIPRFLAESTQGFGSAAAGAAPTEATADAEQAEQPEQGATVPAAAPQTAEAQDQQREPAATPTTAPGEWEVEFIVESPPPHYLKAVTFDPIDLKQHAKEVRAFELLVRREIKRYPELLERSGLTTFVLVHNLRVDGQERGQVPDRFLGRMYASPFIGAHDRVYQRHCVHHEFFHYLMERWTGDVVYPDPGWLALNPPGTKYGSGGVNARGSDQFAFTHPAPGFVNKYAQSAPEEDMCEIFATLHMPEEKRQVMQWAREDQVLRNKMEYMEELIQRYLAETGPDAETAGAASRPAEAAEEAEEGDVAEEADDSTETAERSAVR